MPYQVTVIRNDFRYEAIVPRSELAYTIIKALRDQGATLDDYQSLLEQSQLNSAHILSDAAFQQLADAHPEMTLIYEAMTLKNHQRLYFHTNWTVSNTNWQVLNSELKKYQIDVSTLTTPNQRYFVKRKIAVDS
ncbi:hypothetical protein CYQ88_02785 [Hydrogenovibrio sp. SC-1]|uniref:hypothetical protein n=1 Tax=Hydrogenovibrio sp. SC-1 TaxID=2065820 RepID=UPI000C799304|nr:hypothetical protein [Hydrogenovibrio sp. SC-1]PLA75168.1 hypothetical protein CYQ88_02785 [Hydrogenovibrio sp. SC-1]